MRPVILLVVFSVYTAFSPVFSQAPPTKQDHYAGFMKKRKKNFAAGMVLVGSGPVLSVIGAAINYKAGVDNDPNNNSNGLWMVYLGVGAIVASVPFFIAAGSNKRKALSLKNQPSATLQPLEFKPIPSLTFTIHF